MFGYCGYWSLKPLENYQIHFLRLVVFFGRETYDVGASLCVSAKRLLLRYAEIAPKRTGRRIGGAGSKCSSSAIYKAPIGSSDVTFARFILMDDVRVQ